jgi:hypothetical protein
MSNWNYTAAERRTIGAAWDAVAYLMDSSGHREPHRLREALKVERRERSCVTAARALIVRGFAEGMADDPPASTLAGYSEGIAAGVMLGADYQRRALRFGSDSVAGSLAAKLPALLAAASAAHDAYIGRGLESARASMERAS